MGLTRTRGRREYAGEALAERGRSGVESKANKPIPLGSPIQTAVMKMAAVSFIPKAFNKFECVFFKNHHFFNLSELIYLIPFIFNQ